eukprot:m.19454 g.19454  ORF g.19454 m.19454 type:complete len:151 (-) comp8466_c1_seq1:326-778(-)
MSIAPLCTETVICDYSPVSYFLSNSLCDIFTLKNKSTVFMTRKNNVTIQLTVINKLQKQGQPNKAVYLLVTSQYSNGEKWNTVFVTIIIIIPVWMIAVGMGNFVPFFVLFTPELCFVKRIAPIHLYTCRIKHVREIGFWILAENGWVVKL